MTAQLPALLAEQRPKQRALETMGFARRWLRWHRPRILGGRTQPRPVLVLTTSRSGSTWLCEMLARGSWAGPIPEHLRPPHFTYAMGIHDSGKCLAPVADTIATQMRSGFFGGSKLIWDYFPDLPALADPARCTEVLKPLLDLSPIIVRLQRDDRIAQAISRYRSANTSVFHDWQSSTYGLKLGQRLRSSQGHTVEQSNGHPAASSEDGGANQQNKADQNRAPDAADDGQRGRAAAASSMPPYDFEAIRHHKAVLDRAESALDRFVSALDAPVTTVHYEQVRQHTESELMPLLRQITALPADQLAARLERVRHNSALRPSSSPGRSAWHVRFSEDLAAS